MRPLRHVVATRSTRKHREGPLSHPWTYGDCRCGDVDALSEQRTVNSLATAGHLLLSRGRTERCVADGAVQVYCQTKTLPYELQSCFSQRPHTAS